MSLGLYIYARYYLGTALQELKLLEDAYLGIDVNQRLAGTFSLWYSIVALPR